MGNGVLMGDVDSVQTTVAKKYAYVEFIVNKKVHKLRIEKKYLERGGIFGGDSLSIQLEDLILHFPSINTSKEIDNLRSLWDELVEYGFEPT